MLLHGNLMHFNSYAILNNFKKSVKFCDAVNILLTQFVVHTPFIVSFQI